MFWTVAKLPPILFAFLAKLWNVLHAGAVHTITLLIIY